MLQAYFNNTQAQSVLVVIGAGIGNVCIEPFVLGRLRRSPLQSLERPLLLTAAYVRLCKQIVHRRRIVRACPQSGQYRDRLAISSRPQIAKGQVELRGILFSHLPPRLQQRSDRFFKAALSGKDDSFLQCHLRSGIFRLRASSVLRRRRTVELCRRSTWQRSHKRHDQQERKDPAPPLLRIHTQAFHPHILSGSGIGVPVWRLLVQDIVNEEVLQLALPVGSAGSVSAPGHIEQIERLVGFD